MRIEYTLARHEFVEASLARVQPPAPAPNSRLAWTRAPWLQRASIFLTPIWMLLGVGLYAVGTYRAAQGDRGRLFTRVTDVEWFLPWAIVIGSGALIGLGTRAGRVGVRIAVVVSLTMIVATATLAFVAAQLAANSAMLASFGTARVIPWAFVVGWCIWLVYVGWPGRRFAAAYALSTYTDGSRVLTIDESTLRDENDRVATTWKWLAIRAVRRTAHTLILDDHRGRAAVIVPVRDRIGPRRRRCVRRIAESRGRADRSRVRRGCRPDHVFMGRSLNSSACVSSASTSVPAP